MNNFNKFTFFVVVLSGKAAVKTKLIFFCHVVLAVCQPYLQKSNKHN